MSKKKIIIILLAIALIIVAAFAVYYFYFRKTTPAVVINPDTTTKPTTPVGVIAIDDKLIKISLVAGTSPTTSADGQKIIYMGKQGGLYEVGFDGANQKEDKFIALQNLIKVLWSKNREEFAAIYGGASGRKIFYYNTKTKDTAPYDANIKALAFSKIDDKISYYSSNDLQNTNSVFTADPNGSNAKIVFNTRIKDIRVEWVSENKIAVSTVPSAFLPNVLWVLNTETQKLMPVLSQIYGFTAKWAPSGNKFIFSQTNSKGANLSLFTANQTGTEVKNANIATLPEKCVFSALDENIVFCAVPKSAPDIVWPDDYYKRLYSAQEQIWSLNLSTGKNDLLYEFNDSLSFDATDLTLSPQEDRLVFLNKKDDQIYSLKIK